MKWYNYKHRSREAKYFSVKLYIFSYLSVLTFVLGAQKNRLNETVLLSTHNIWIGWEIRKLIFDYTLLSGGLYKHKINFLKITFGQSIGNTVKSC